MLKKLLYILLLTFTLQLLTFNLLAQSFSWQRTYHPVMEGDEGLYDICPADGNNYYIVGYTGTTQYKWYVIKINPFGDTIWAKVPGFGEIYSVAPVSDGGCIFAGYSGQAFACRIKPNGDTVWRRTYNTINFQDIKKTTDGAYVLCGANYSNSHYNGYVCKIDTLGNLLWEQIYPATLTLDVIRIELALDGGYIIGGQKKNYSGGPANAYIAKINDTGALQWEREYQINTNNIVSGIQTKNSGYVLTGWSNDKLYLLKTNINGDSIYSKIFVNTSNIGDGPALLKENNNKYYVAHINGGDSRVYSVDSNFNIINQLTLQAPGPSAVWLFSLIKVQNSNSGDIICVGTSDYFDFANLDAYAVRLDSLLSPPKPIGIINYSNTSALDYLLSENYPNPFNPETEIKFSIPQKSFVEVKIYNILGSEAETLVNEDLPAGNYHTKWNAAGFASGIYFVTLLAGSIKLTKKLVLIK